MGCGHFIHIKISAIGSFPPVELMGIIRRHPHLKILTVFLIFRERPSSRRRSLFCLLVYLGATAAKKSASLITLSDRLSETQFLLNPGEAPLMAVKPSAAAD